MVFNEVILVDGSKLYVNGAQTPIFKIKQIREDAFGVFITILPGRELQIRINGTTNFISRADANTALIAYLQIFDTCVKKAEQDQLGNVIDLTYETKAVVSGINTRVINLENANMVKDVDYEPITHVITFTFFDGTTQLLDLPLESTIVSASYDNITKDITFTLQNGETLVVPLDDLVEGLANETWVTQQINNVDYVSIQNQDIQQKQKMKLYIVDNQIGYDIEEE